MSGQGLGGYGGVLGLSTLLPTSPTRPFCLLLWPDPPLAELLFRQSHWNREMWEIP